MTRAPSRGSRGGFEAASLAIIVEVGRPKVTPFLSMAENNDLGRPSTSTVKRTFVMPHESDDQCGEQEARRRLEATLRGAFSGSPTPLKDVPKKGGEPRTPR